MSLRLFLVLSRIAFFSNPSGRFDLGINITHGNCGQCEAYHFDVTIALGWVGILLFLGQKIKVVEVG